MSRLFISHSSTDNAAAKAFKQWLCRSGWASDDVFLDLDDIGAGERWKEALRRASAVCEAVILLASSESLTSPECIAEVRRAEDYGKDILVVILRDVELDDRRLAAFKDRQIVDVSAKPTGHVEVVEYRGEDVTTAFNERELGRIYSYLLRRGLTPDAFEWSPKTGEDSPFPGLVTFKDEDAGIFFGRDADIVRGLDKLRVLRRDGRPSFAVIQAASGAGKSSYLRAGLWPRLRRDPDFAPIAIVRGALGPLTGKGGLGEEFAKLLSRPGSAVRPGEIHARLMADDVLEARHAFLDLVSRALDRLADQRRVANPNAAAPTLVIAIDQAEELLSEDDEAEKERFLELLSAGASGPGRIEHLLFVLAIRSDKSAQMLARLTEASGDVPEVLPLLPLPSSAYREIVVGPLRVLAKHGRKVTFEPALVERLAADAEGADALPMLAFTLSHLFREFGAGGRVTLADYESTGGVAGSITRALRAALSQPAHPPAIASVKAEQLARLEAAFIPWLARIDVETDAPARRPARFSELPSDSLPYVERLIEARLLVKDHRDGTAVVEIAHESLLRQWPDLVGWLDKAAADMGIAERLTRAAREWHSHGRSADWLEHRGRRLKDADRVVRQSAYRESMAEREADYLRACRRRARATAGGNAAAIAVFTLLIGTGIVTSLYPTALSQLWFRVAYVLPHRLAGHPDGDQSGARSFRDCGSCPIMTVLPSGTFLMGSPDRQGDPSGREYPAHRVAIEPGLSISLTTVTAEQWELCSSYGPCPAKPRSGGGTHPVTDVSWADARLYTRWLSAVTGKPYRLLSEAEYEYAARAGSMEPFPWGQALGVGRADCGDCNPDRGRASGPMATASFPANRFGLHDMVGNVSSWTEDCFQDNYRDAPVDGSAWTSGACRGRVIRGGAWVSRGVLTLRSAFRDWAPASTRNDRIGFRIACRVDAGADDAVASVAGFR